ncbi:YhaN family protein [Cupriavidus sp. UYPR2.512]|uniref:YhaN family protein n=1 Tax=Cupriavidus sp. UYPR2.512 TaxID=1080187 RepID=UPI00039A2119|nr:YhaN family protein [Cupriavidus sp. UYPR2.512]
MRIKQLELIRYGKFTGDTVDFPRSELDFHFMVGPNEAGKSTIKTAISELLFGMPHSSSLDFIHHQSELRLGAALENREGTLTFHRSKARKSPLTTPAGESLPVDSLAPLLGVADKAFFEQMFCLDHTALIKGGRSILDASSDVGQVLFQSAAGIASLGRVRDELAEEADRLWAKRKSGDRAYYVGQKQLDEANAELKAAMVRTAAWRAAHGAVEEAKERQEVEEERRRELELKRNQLERVRRLAPHLNVWRENAGELSALGEVLDLPADAEATLNSGLTKLAAAEGRLKVHNESAEQLEGDLNGISVDHALLSLQKDIQDLEATRHQCRNYGPEIAQLEQQVGLLLGEISDACTELGWPEDEEGARKARPNSMSLQTVSSLMRSRGALELAASTAEQSVNDKLADINELTTHLEAAPHSEAPIGLQAALRAAQKYRDTQVTQRRLKSDLDNAESVLKASLAILGKWSRPTPELRSMTLPSTERISSLRSERQELLSRKKLAEERLEEANERAHSTNLEVDKFAQAHQLVTVDQVRDARSIRDSAWTAIKAGEVTLSSGAPAFEEAIRAADDLSDQHVGSVTDATQLLNLKQRLIREQEALSRQEKLSRDAEAAVVKFDTEWESLMAAQELPEMAFDDISSWAARRDDALKAAEEVRKSSENLRREVEDAEEAGANLAKSLTKAGIVTEEQCDIDALCCAGEHYIGDIEQAKTLRKHRERQLDTVQVDLVALRRDEKLAKDAYAHWESDWSDAIAKAGLATASGSEASTEAAIAIVNRISERLDRVKTIRTSQVNVMRSALDAFSSEARRLAQHLDASLVELDAEGISIELSRRLKVASAAQSDVDRLKKELVVANDHVNKARTEVDEATAQLRPLYLLAAVGSPDLLRPLIARSDRKRALLGAIGDAKNNLLSGGDGLALEELVEELDGSDIQTVHTELTRVGNELAASVKAHGDIATELGTARQALTAISGAANAAIAEAKRQEALSAMAEAAERFIKVETAYTLLRWAIDRYRERRQGPMLSRASAIFSQLTLGAFARLSVDYDKQPMALSAIRANGNSVGISGMSEGTRDQLYMALRLAAVELQLEQASALPFVADDLFINFDDKRTRAGLQVQTYPSAPK